MNSKQKIKLIMHFHPKKIIALTIYITFLLFVFILFYQLGHPMLKSFFFNSDALYLPILFQNLFEQHGHLKDWYLTPAPYFFPDYLIYSIAYLLGSSVASQMALYAAFQIFLLGITVYSLFKVLAVNSSKSLMITSTLLITTLLIILAFQNHHFTSLLLSGFHYGCFLMEIGGLALVIHTIKYPHKNLSLTILCVLAFLTTCSDTLFFTQFILPMALAFVFTIWCTVVPHWKLCLAKLTLPILSSLFGFLIYPLIIAHPTRYSSRLGLIHLASNFRDIQTIFQTLYESTPFVSFYLLCFYIVSFLIMGIWMTKRIRTHLEHTNPPLVFLHVFILLSLIISLIIMLSITRFTPTARYFIPVMSLPLILGIRWISTLRNAAYPLIFGGLIFCASYLNLAVFHLYQHQDKQEHYYPEEIACIDHALANQELHHGIAQYWDAKFIQAYSKNKLIIAQYEKNLEEHRWITSDAFFQSAYDFAIITTPATNPDFTISQDKINHHNEQPLKTIQCGRHTLLIYPPNMLKTRSIAHLGDIVSWKGCELPSVMGYPTSPCAMRADHIKTPGFLTYGPYEILPAGEYQFEIVYKSPLSSAHQAGIWDIISTNSKHQLQSGTLRGTHGRVKRIIGKFTVNPKYHLAKIEIRTQAYPGQWMQMNKLTIKRLK